MSVGFQHNTLGSSIPLVGHWTWVKQCDTSYDWESFPTAEKIWSCTRPSTPSIRLASLSLSSLFPSENRTRGVNLSGTELRRAPITRAVSAKAVKCSSGQFWPSLPRVLAYTQYVFLWTVYGYFHFCGQKQHKEPFMRDRHNVILAVSLINHTGCIIWSHNG